ncbi:MAG: hypothetical protein JSV88_02500 [Candidatus Aminicenantes bacterium]|nr:MAG: hypothetical protein JSV88_02500 [Candidatus Aminicenantes bacterium]
MTDDQRLKSKEDHPYLIELLSDSYYNKFAANIRAKVKKLLWRLKK